MTVRRKLSDFVNHVLGKFGYAFIRLSNGIDIHPNFDLKRKGAYAYEHLLLLDVLAPLSQDEEFIRTYDLIKKNTLVDVFRCYELYQLVYEVRHVEGDIIEVGVWRGGTGGILAAAAKRWKPNAKVWLCDTFEGVVKAGSFDTIYEGGEHADTSIEFVEKILEKIGTDNVTILKGIFPDQSGHQICVPNIALCHIDVDVYQSAADVVAWVRPLMKPGACLVFDDYGYSTCQGVTKFVDELRISDEWIFIYNLNKHAILAKR